MMVYCWGEDMWCWHRQVFAKLWHHVGSWTCFC